MPGNGRTTPQMSITLEMNASKVTRYNSMFEIFDINQPKVKKKPVLNPGNGRTSPQLSITLEINASKVRRYNSMFEIFDNNQSKLKKKRVLKAGNGQYNASNVNYA